MIKGGNSVRKIWMSALVATLAVTGRTSEARADELRPFCADRPGLGTPACTMDSGHVMIESGLVDWTRTRDPAARTDTITAGDVLLRLGVNDRLEVQAGWTAFGHNRERDRPSGAVQRDNGTGDVTLAARYNLHNPDGEGFSTAIMPYISLPTGGSAIGAGTASAGILVPISYGLSESVTVSVTPEIDAAADGDRHGRHLAYGSVIGIGTDIRPSLSGTLEFQAMRDNDPDGHSTQALAGLSLAWQPQDRLQLDIGGVAGLNHASPDAQLYVGIARRF
jgi:hypothetical protein